MKVEFVFSEESKHQMLVAKPKYLIMAENGLLAMTFRIEASRPSQLTMAIRESRDPQGGSRSLGKLNKKNSHSEAELIEFLRKRFTENAEKGDPNSKFATRKRLLTNYFVKRRVLYGRVNNGEAYDSRKERAVQVTLDQRKQADKLREFMVNENPVKLALRHFGAMLDLRKDCQKAFRTKWAQLLWAVGLVDRLRTGKSTQKQRMLSLSEHMRLLQGVMLRFSLQMKRSSRRASLVRHLQGVAETTIQTLLGAGRGECQRSARGVLRGFLGTLALRKYFEDYLSAFTEQCGLIRHHAETVREAVHAEI